VQVGGDLGLADRDPQALPALRAPVLVVDESHVASNRRAAVGCIKKLTWCGA
jgi:hypothetical protein